MGEQEPGSIILRHGRSGEFQAGRNQGRGSWVPNVPAGASWDALQGAGDGPPRSTRVATGEVTGKPTEPRRFAAWDVATVPRRAVSADTDRRETGPPSPQRTLPIPLPNRRIRSAPVEWREDPAKQAHPCDWAPSLGRLMWTRKWRANVGRRAACDASLIGDRRRLQRNDCRVWSSSSLRLTLDRGWRSDADRFTSR